MQMKEIKGERERERKEKKQSRLSEKRRDRWGEKREKKIILPVYLRPEPIPRAIWIRNEPTEFIQEDKNKGKVGLPALQWTVTEETWHKIEDPGKFLTKSS